MNTVSDTTHKQKIWHGVLAELQLQVSKPVYATCFANTRLVSFEENVATIGCPNPMMIQMIESRYYSLVKSVIDHRTKKDISLVFKVAQMDNGLKNPGPLFADATSKIKTTMIDRTRQFGLNSEYTFDNFAVSSTNQMAYAAATAIAKDPGTAYNPLLLYGGVGVGKTHLMQAIGHAILQYKQTTRVVFCMGDEFTNEIIEGIQLKTTRQFKQKYRKAELLLVDDIQFIAGKQAVQEEFFHTFNAIRRAGGQIVLTSDRSPSEIARLEERLRSRFEAGLMIDIGVPDFELRTAIINIKSKMLGLELSPDIAQLIAANITAARSIEGFLRRIKSEQAAKETTLTHASVSDLLGKRATVKESEKRATPQQVVDTVCEYYRLKKSQIKGSRRSRPIVRPRQIVMHICKTDLGLTLTDIGKLLGGRDHTTIMHGVETITKELSTNQQLRVDVEGIKQRLWR